MTAKHTRIVQKEKHSKLIITTEQFHFFESAADVMSDSDMYS